MKVEQPVVKNLSLETCRATIAASTTITTATIAAITAITTITAITITITATGTRQHQASCTSIGTSRNSQHNYLTIAPVVCFAIHVSNFGMLHGLI